MKAWTKRIPYWCTNTNEFLLPYFLPHFLPFFLTSFLFFFFLWLIDWFTSLLFFSFLFIYFLHRGRGTKRVCCTLLHSTLLYSAFKVIKKNSLTTTTWWFYEDCPFSARWESSYVRKVINIMCRRRPLNQSYGYPISKFLLNSLNLF